MPEPLPEAIAAGLMAMGLLKPGQLVPGEALAGGVSSDIWHVILPNGQEICVKRALPKLKVAADWRAPVMRNIYEARWLAEADRALPGAVPRLLGQDEATGALAMAYLSPADHPGWNARLQARPSDPGFPAGLPPRLASLHALPRPQLV